MGDIMDKKMFGLLEALIEMQKKNGQNYIDETGTATLADQFDITENQVKDTATFYRHLSFQPRGRHIIRLCSSPCCWLQGGREIAEQVKDILGIGEGETTSDGQFTLEYTGCIGACDQSPAMMVDDKVIGNLTEEKVRTVLKEILKEETKPVELCSAKWCDSTVSLCEVLQNPPSRIIEVVKESGLRGRGGAFFPTAVKMETVAEAPSLVKYIVCNADEGEPGTFKDRYLLEEKCQQVLEGMILAAYGVGASQGYIYLRGEYACLRSNLEKVLAKLRTQGMLGENICGSGFSFHIEVCSGAGAYICGEESALLSSLEGLRGLTRVKPPIPAVRGLFGCPTLIDNVETFACIDRVLSGEAADTKLVCLSGAFRNKGVFEVPFGMPVKELIESVGGGAEDGKCISFLQFGGLSGSFVLPDKLEGLTYDPDSLRKHGLSLGTGAIFAGTEDMDFMEYLLCAVKFYQEESCGRCAPCREGLKQICSELERMPDPKAVERLHRMKALLAAAAGCGLGQGVASMVESGLKLLQEKGSVSV